MCTRHLVALACLLLTVDACVAGGPETIDTTLTVRNVSQFELLEVRVHDGEDYRQAPNVLTAPLATDADVVVPFTTNQRITVFRPRVDVGEVMAMTTAEDLEVVRPGFVLLVFDDGFRLVEP